MEFLEILAWIPLAAAGLSAASSIAGGLISSAGQAATNAANIQQQQIANAQQQAQFQQSLAHAQWQSDATDRRLVEDRAFNADEARLARDFNSAEAEKQRVWAELLSSNAYQRAMADMRQAGLNPILAYQQGGASSPSGAAASGPAARGSGSGSPTSVSAGSAGAARLENTHGELGKAVGNMVSNAVDTMKTLEGVDLMKQQVKESQQREVVGAADARLKHWDAEKREREVANTETQGDILKAQAKTAQSISRVAAGEAGNMERYGRKEAPDTMERILRTIQGWFEQSGVVNLPKGD